MKFRHKPTEVEAWQWLGQIEDAWPPWLRGYRLHEDRSRPWKVDATLDVHNRPYLLIPMPGGFVGVNLNDWVVLDQFRLLQQVEPEVFLAKYEPIKS